MKSTKKIQKLILKKAGGWILIFQKLSVNVRQRWLHTCQPNKLIFTNEKCEKRADLVFKNAEGVGPHEYPRYLMLELSPYIVAMHYLNLSYVEFVDSPPPSRVLVKDKQKHN